MKVPLRGFAFFAALRAKSGLGTRDAHELCEGEGKPRSGECISRSRRDGWAWETIPLRAFLLLRAFAWKSGTGAAPPGK
jgi:hypothetical protein